ncbi:hypothetical protein KMC46_gp44 [Ralstonia phage Gamede]|uniref:Uncharacterized protein n=1 Tax=Ralstonia phage Gamede TaxID=2759726 RepID=A0A7M1IE09_9CAUD|nr:hypothetical protein KMC46_gp44 [Ralstonia phage Gamede]QOQ37807.1 hypothetical protein 9Ga_00045 [Ralstonia phage Gamede]
MPDVERRHLWRLVRAQASQQLRKLAVDLGVANRLRAIALAIRCRVGVPDRRCWRGRFRRARLRRFCRKQLDWLFGALRSVRRRRDPGATIPFPFHIPFPLGKKKRRSVRDVHACLTRASRVPHACLTRASYCYVRTFFWLWKFRLAFLVVDDLMPCERRYDTEILPIHAILPHETTRRQRVEHACEIDIVVNRALHPWRPLSWSPRAAHDRRAVVWCSP